MRKMRRQTVKDGIDHTLDRLATGVDHQMRTLPIQRITQPDQRFNARARVFGAQQWSCGVPAQALPEVTYRRTQIDHLPSLVQCGAIDRIDHRAAAGGQHGGASAREFVDEFGFALPESGFAFEFEDGRDGHAQPRFELAIGINEGPAESACQTPTDCGFTGAHHADQADEGGAGRGSHPLRILRAAGLVAVTTHIRVRFRDSKA